jgi:hypothetical protein
MSSDYEIRGISLYYQKKYDTYMKRWDSNICKEMLRLIALGIAIFSQQNRSSKFKFKCFLIRTLLPY